MRQKLTMCVVEFLAHFHVRVRECAITGTFLLLRRFRVVVLEKSTQSIVDGEKDKHIDHREHQTGMDTGVKGGKVAVSYFGHVVRAGGMEDDVMLARMNGARKRGRPRQRWVDTLKG